MAVKNQTQYIRFKDDKLVIAANLAGNDVRSVTYKGALVGELHRVVHSVGRDEFCIAAPYGRPSEQMPLIKAARTLGVRALCPPPVVLSADEIAF